MVLGIPDMNGAKTCVESSVLNNAGSSSHELFKELCGEFSFE